MIHPPRLSPGAGIPPKLADTAAPIRRVFRPFVAAARAAGVRHIVFLSVQGAGERRYIPHAQVERVIKTAAAASAAAPAKGRRGKGGPRSDPQQQPLRWTFIRACVFMQGLARAPFRLMIRDARCIELPAAGAELNWAGEL